MPNYSLLSTPAFAHYIVSFLVGALYALVVPTLSLHLSQTYQTSALWIGIFFIGKAISSIASSQFIARWSDKLSDRRPLIAAAMCCGAASCFLFSIANSYLTMLLVATSIFGISFSANAQFMAQTREFADDCLPPHQATFFNSVVRACIAIAWVSGPPIGFLLMAKVGFDNQCRLVGGCYLATAIVAYFVLPKANKKIMPPPMPDAVIPTRNWTLIGAIVAFSLMFATNCSYQIALPLMIAEKLQASPEYAGFLMGTAALLEIPLMVLAGYLGTRMHLLPLIRIGAAASIILYLGVWQATAIWHLFVLQIFNAIFVGFMAGLGMTWFQNLLPGQTGLSSSYFSNCNGMGEILGYLIIALIAQNLGYGHMYGFSVWVAAAAFLLLVFVCRQNTAIPSSRAPTAS